MNQSKPSFLLSWLSEVICYSDRKLTHVPHACLSSSPCHTPSEGENAGAPCSAWRTGGWRDVTGNCVSSHADNLNLSLFPWFQLVLVFICFRGMVIDTRALSNFQRFPTEHPIQSVRLGYLWIVTPFMFSPQSWLQDCSLRGLSVLSFRDAHPSSAFECLISFTRLWRALLLCPLLSLPFIYALL